MSAVSHIAASDAPKGKGGTAEAARPIQEKAMLNVAERPSEGKTQNHRKRNPGTIDPSPYITMSDSRKTAIWLDGEIEKSQIAITTQVTQLTPDLARVLLGRNPSNRTISEATVGNYQRDILAGGWRFNGEPIIVSKEGTLNDGQHRCMAVILAGQSIPVVLIIGVDRDTRTTLDQGRIRTAGDYLSMVGHTDPNTLAAAGRMVWQWQKYTFISASAQYRPTKSELFALVESTPRLENSVRAVSTTNIATAGSRSMLGFCHFAFSVAAVRSEVEAFLHGLTTGENLNGDSPILYVRNRLLAEKARLKVGERAELIFRGWNAYRRGETPKSIAIQGGELPLLES